MANQPSKYSKFLVGAASAALVASAVAPVASAADFSDVKGNTHEDAINALVKAGVISGYPDGTFLPNKTLSRSDVVKMMGKLLVSLGKEVPTDYKTVQRFDDLPLNANEELVKYAALTFDAGVFKGNNGKLDAAGNITRENMAIVLVRAYDAINKTDLVAHVKEQEFKKDVTDLATAKEEARAAIDVLDFYDITNPVAPKFNPKATTTRGQFASFLFKTTAVEVPAEKVTTATKVESVTATNLKEVVVTFDGTVDKATAGEAVNYSITQGSSTVVVDKAVVSEDAKSVVLTVVGVLASQKEHKLAVNNVKAGDKVLNQKDVAFTPVDTTLPTVSKVEALGNKTVRVSFSEPVQTALTSNFTIDDKVVVGSIKTAGNSVILKLSSELTDGEHSLSASGVKDFAGFVSVKSEAKFNVVEDKVAPTVTKVVSASFEKVVLQFSEPIEQVLSGNVYWMQGASKKYPDVNGVKQLSDDTYEFTFSGTNKLVYTTDLYVAGVKDYSGNEIAKDTKVQVNPVIDQTRPEVLSAELDKDTLKTVKVKFSKALSTDSAKKTANYVIKDKDGKVQFITNNITLADGNKTAVLTLVNKLADNNEYTLTINGVSDNTTLQNVILPYTTTLTVKDVTGPTLSSIKRLDKNTLVIDYNEAMSTSGDGNVLDPAKYTFVNGSTKYVPVDLRITGDSKSVIVVFDKDISAVELTATVRLVKDIAGNYIAPLEKTYTVGINDLVTTGIKDVVATGTKTVVVEFDRSLQSLNADDFVIKNASVTNKIVNASLSTNGKKATFTLETAVAEDASNLTYATVSSPTSQDSLGGTLAAKTTPAAVKDEISATLAVDSNDQPLVVATGGTATEFTLTFNENIKATAGAHAFIEVKDANGDALKVTSAIANGSGKDLVVTLSEAVVGGTVTIALKENPLVTDTAGNKVAAIEAIQVDGVAITPLGALTTTITSAQAAHDAINEGSEVGNTVVGAKATLQAAINAATAVKNNGASTAQQLTDAKTTLATAVTASGTAPKVVAITGLTAPALTTVTPGTTNKGNITGVTLAAGETFNVTSATVANVTVDAANGLAVTGAQVGTSVITVQVKNAAGSVIKTGTVTVTVTAL